ncbi:MAG TPA: TlpA disulfide reductase family protein [Candidatus Acidoferrales bacterium]
MKRSFIFVLAVIAGLSGIAIGLGAGRVAQPHITKAIPSLPHFSSAALRSAATPENHPSKSQSDAGHVVRFASNPQPMPAFLVNDISGNPVSTASWKGKVVLLNFWATWCPPCRAEVPMLVDLANRYKDRVQVVGVSLDDGPDEVKQFVKDEGINYPVVMASREIVAEYGGVPALPTLFVVNPDGKVVQKHEGLYSRELYETEIRLLLGLPSEATIETFQDTGQIFLKNASLATELPNVNFAGLTAEQKKIALRKLNSDRCDCGCRLTLAQCRINDTSCGVSKALAAGIVKQIASSSANPTPTETPVTPHE